MNRFRTLLWKGLGVWGLVAGFTCPGAALAQAERYELGKRLIEFEKCWDQHADAERRAKACEKLDQAVQLFFGARLGQAGEAIEEARRLLAGESQTPAQRWARSLYLKVERRFLESLPSENGQGFATSEVEIRLQPFYQANEPIPENARLLISEALLPLGQTSQQEVSLPIRDWPLVHKHRFTLGQSVDLDGYLHYRILVGEKPVLSGTVALSAARNLSKRLAVLQEKLDRETEPGRSTEALTLRERVRLLKVLADQRSPETDYPAARLLAEAEALAQAVQEGKPYFGQGRAGMFWLTLPQASSPVQVRLQAPSAARERKPLPLVLALHGAGGSENMFFDTYGHGLAARLAGERGWLFAAPRVGLGMNLAGLIDAIDALYPVDRQRVFVVGHSMGAAAALTAAGQSPRSFAGIAALGGGRAIRVQEPMKSLPFFVGIGDKDFAYRGAQGLADALKKADVKTVEYREYPRIEHLAIVQVALPDVYAFFDRLSRQ